MNRPEATARHSLEIMLVVIHCGRRNRGLLTRHQRIDIRRPFICEPPTTQSQKGASLMTSAKFSDFLTPSPFVLI